MSSELGKEREKERCFSSCHERGTKKKLLRVRVRVRVSMRNRT